jgi:hypothetical protein
VGSVIALEALFAGPVSGDMTPDQFRGVRNLIEMKVKGLIATL